LQHAFYYDKNSTQSSQQEDASVKIVTDSNSALTSAKQDLSAFKKERKAKEVRKIHRIIQDNRYKIILGTEC
jgi:hypothetical protein